MKSAWRRVFDWAAKVDHRLTPGVDGVSQGMAEMNAATRQVAQDYEQALELWEHLRSTRKSVFSVSIDPNEPSLDMIHAFAAAIGAERRGEDRKLEMYDIRDALKR